MTEEKWQTIPGFTEYEVSNLGRVRSWRVPLRTKRQFRSAHRRLANPLILNPVKGPDGYRRMILRKPGNDKEFGLTVHRLVLLTFVGNPPTDRHTDCAHLNGIRGDDRLENLQWMTHQGNSQMMIQHGRTRCGEKNWNSFLTADRVKEIRERHKAAKCPYATLADEFGLQEAHIGKIVRRDIWAHID